MIRVKLKGGIGNQLFQFSMAVYLQMIQKTEIALEHIPTGVNRMSSIIPYLNLSLGHVSSKSMHVGDHLVHQHLMDRSEWFLRFRHPLSRLVTDEAEIVKLHDDKQSQDIVLNGYFQNSKIVANLRLDEYIKKSYLLADKMKSFEQLVEDPSTATIHIRGGDFLSAANLSGVLDQTYYLEAIRLIEKKKRIERLVVFTDDPAYSSEILGAIAKDTAVVGVDSVTHPMDYLICMSRARTIVLSNSTFSWWAGYFSRNSFVVAPKCYTKKCNSTLEPMDSWWQVPSIWKE